MFLHFNHVMTEFRGNLQVTKR